MKRLLLMACTCAVVSAASGQRLHVSLFAGASNYQGDLQGKRFTFQQANLAAGAGLLYELGKQLFVRGNLAIGKLRSDDKVTRVYLDRNLSFSSPVYEASLGLEYDILNNYEKPLVPYVFAGIAVFHFNPSTIDAAGNKVFLQPLGTEGQGFYLGRQKYALTQFAIPFGAGLKFSLSDDIRLRLEAGLRKTMTDYIDDLSTTYADEGLLLLNNGAKAVELAYRGDEYQPGLTYPPDNTIRGNPGSKDWYYFTGVGISVRVSSITGGGINSRRSRTGCPVNIY